MKFSGVYQIQSKSKPERIYIGSGVIIQRRWWEHLRHLRKGDHSNSRLQNHYNKYGINDLQFSVLVGCTKEDLIKTEQYFIDAFNPYFNILKIAGQLTGRRQWNLGLKMGPPANAFKKGHVTWSTGIKFKKKNYKKERSQQERDAISEGLRKAWAKRKAG